MPDPFRTLMEGDPFEDLPEDEFRESFLRISGIAAEQEKHRTELAERRRLRKQHRAEADRQAQEISQRPRDTSVNGLHLNLLARVAMEHTPTGMLVHTHEGLYESDTGGILSLPEPSTNHRLYYYLRGCARVNLNLRNDSGSLRVPAYLATFRAHRTAVEWMRQSNIAVDPRSIAAARREISRKMRQSNIDPAVRNFVDEASQDSGEWSGVPEFPDPR